MRTPITLPELGLPESRKVTLSVWYARQGDFVFEGDRLVEVLTDGATSRRGQRPVGVDPRRDRARGHRPTAAVANVRVLRAAAAAVWHPGAPGGALPERWPRWHRGRQVRGILR